MTTGDLHRDRGPILSMDDSNAWFKSPKVKDAEADRKCETAVRQQSVQAGREFSVSTPDRDLVYL